MSVLQGKKILLGVSGGIAAYKTTFLVRLLIKAEAEVKVVMTPASKDFVTPLTLATLSKNPVHSEFLSEAIDGNPFWNNHVELALWADLILIAPATVNTLSKMAHGNCDNLLIATYLSAKCPVYFAPAMDLDMYKHPATKVIFSQLNAVGNTIIPAESGELASGLSGEGRMAEPENIVAFLEQDLGEKLPLKGKKILITAGPTYEAIDPVRFIGNHASGKMGFDLANAAALLGAEVVLVSGPSALSPAVSSVQCLRVTDATSMFEVASRHFTDSDVFIAAAAVADYRPKKVAVQKIKKSDKTLVIELERTTDILATLSALKTKQFIVGFALETENEIENALLKAKKKNVDLMVLNSLNDEGAGFGKSTNKVTFIDKASAIESFPLKSKEAVAQDILNKVIQYFYA